MLTNYFKTAWRNIVKNKAHGFINISGLSIGMAVAMLIGLWIWDELSFDAYNKNYNDIAQIARKEITNGGVYVSSGSNHFPIPLADELRKNYQNLFKHVSIVTEVKRHILDFNGKKFAEQGLYAEQDFVNIFTLKMIKGSSADFSDLNSILLSQSAALALFGNADAIGQVVKLDNMQPLKVTGVFENLPRNSTFSEVNFFCPWSLLVSTNKDVKDKLDDWDNSSYYIFTQSQPGISMEKISGLIKNIYWAKIKDKQVKTAGSRVDLFLHPMKDWHLRSEWKNGVHAAGQIQIVWLFGMIGVFVLMLACINFMNLSTARSESRAKEVGIRKAVGSLRSQLVKQFLGESLLYALLAFIISVILSSASLNWFNQIADKKIIFPFSNGLFWTFSLVFIVLTACLAGS